MTNHRICALVSVAAGLSAAATAPANPVTFSFSQGNLAASAKFEAIGGELVITLTNTSTFDVLVPADVLMAVFFDVQGAPTLTRNSGVLGGTSAVRFGPAPAGGVVGGEYAYREGLVGAPLGAGYGISGAGYGLFAPSDNFPGANLSGPVNVNGLEFGILSLGDNIGTGNSAVTGGGGPMVQNEVVFRLGGLPAGFDPEASIGNVSLQYGTNLSEPNLPAPSAGLVLALAAGFGLRRRR